MTAVCEQREFFLADGRNVGSVHGQGGRADHEKRRQAMTLGKTLLVGVISGIVVGIVMFFLFKIVEVDISPAVVSGITGGVVGGVVPAVLSRKSK